jgi:hypothetical protein
VGIDPFERLAVRQGAPGRGAHAAGGEAGGAVPSLPFMRTTRRRLV